MAKNNPLEESQQSSEGKAIGTSGNQGGKTTSGMKGPHDAETQKGEISIPNQERYSKGKQDSRSGTEEA